MAAVQPAGAAECVTSVDVNGVIHPVTVEILGRALAQAEKEGCRLLLVRMNTPGGFLEATREATEKILSSKIPVVVYVTPGGGRAASAGFFLLEAADVAAMAPGTHAGAAHPVMLGGIPDEVMKRKVESDAAAGLRSVVNRRGRNSELAEKAVLESRSYTDQEALKNRLIDLIAKDERELLAQISEREVRRFDGTAVRLQVANAEVRPLSLSLRQELQAALSDPNLALALVVLGALGLYIEFTTPGVIFPGVAGGILLLLGLGALSVFPLNWMGVALLVLALALFALEVKIASHGVLGAGGVAAMVLGALMLIDSPFPETRIRLSTALGLALPFGAIVVFLLTLIVQARIRRPETGSESVAGSAAMTLTELAPAGKVSYRGEIWAARAASVIPANSEVRVKSMRGLELEVEPADTNVRTGG